MPTPTKPTEELDRRIGEVIRRFRKMNHLTQSDLAESTGVTQGYISQLENGIRNTRLTLSNLQRIAHALQFETLSSMIEAAEGIPVDQIGQRLDHLLNDIQSLKVSANAS